MAAQVRLGLFGAGRIGRFHAATIAHRCPDAILCAIVDASASAAEALANTTGTARWGTDPELIFGDPALDAVLIASPGPTHVGLIQQAAARGKPIFCEKPLSLDLAECDAALAATRAAGVPLQLGFQRRFDTGYLRAKAMIDAGELGTLQTIHSRTRPKPPNTPSTPANRSIWGHDGVKSLRWTLRRAQHTAELTACMACGARRSIRPHPPPLARGWRG